MKHGPGHPATLLSLIAGLLFTPTLIADVFVDTDAESTFNLGEAITTSELAAQRGREGIHAVEISDLLLNDLDATVTDNVVQSSHNGDNVIGGGSFSGSSGHMTIFQNTGHNNVFQEATIYNFNLAP